MRPSKLPAAAPRLILFTAVLSASLVIAADKKKSSSIDDSKRVLHALNRLTFGPRPGEIERVKELGLEKWIEQQLHPQKIDDAPLEARLEPLRTLRMDSRELTEKFPPAPVVRAVAEGRRGMPSDANERAVYQSAIDRYRTRQARKAEQQSAAGDDPGAPMQNVPDEERQKRRDARIYAELHADALLAMPPKQQFAEILKMSPEQRQALMRTLSEEERTSLLNGLTPEQRETVMALLRPEAVVVNELQQAKLLRAVYSDRQLQEVMIDFWFNHFNVFINKGADRYLTTTYERDVIRPHVFGKFKDLLKATAQSPAMLFYLDNWESVGPNSEVGQGILARRRPQNRRGFGRRFPRRPPMDAGEQTRRPQQNRPRGLNENYAREIMELHTLGVDGGYTQKDVTELAKVFTGWTVRQPRMGGEFEFNSRMHEPGDKVLLGRTIHGGGEKEGDKAIEMLAKHPSTARFISRKLAMRFVSDDPPAALVERMSQTFLKTDGDIREVLRTLFKSPEFWAPEAYRAKVKTPLEFVASVMRATGSEVTSVQPLIQALNRMGMPLYGMQPPTGYSTKSEAWVNSSALLNRMNFALAVGSGRMTGVKFDPAGILPSEKPLDAAGALAALETTLLAGEISAQTHETLKKQLSDPQISNRSLDDPDRAPNLGVLAGLILGSPEFQRR
jgi:uncharacterized protein (DUF1800 family)